MELLQFYIDDVIKAALKEDINYLDAATDGLIDPQSRSSARFVAKASGVAAGVSVAARVFELLDPDVCIDRCKNDGDPVEPGEVILTLSGRTAALLKGERTALNLIQHMSGIATATRRLVDLTAGTKAVITETRKTLPGLRALQKYAVTAGGGRNHRYNLSDCAMLKDNHIDAYGSIGGAVAALKKKLGHTVKIEVEARNLDEVRQALAAGVDIIMLDNMTCDAMRQAVEYVGGRAVLEASGNITAQTVRAVAETGVDVISVGALTHSVQALDISMQIDL